jgi:hypothetical protein
MASSVPTVVHAGLVRVTPGESTIRDVLSMFVSGSSKKNPSSLASMVAELKFFG